MTQSIFELRLVDGIHAGRDLVRMVDEEWLRMLLKEKRWVGEGSSAVVAGKEWLLDGQVMTQSRLQEFVDANPVTTVENRHAIYRKYPSVGDQLDMIFKEIVANGSISVTGEWVRAISAVKEANPKVVVEVHLEQAAEEDTYVEVLPSGSE